MNRTILFAAIASLLLAGNANAAKYIVSYDSNRASSVRSSVVKAGGKITRQFEIIDAFVAEIPDTRSAEKISRIKGVQAVEEDKVINWLSGTTEINRSSYELPSLQDILTKIRTESKDANIPMVSAPEITEDAYGLDFASIFANEVPWGVARVKADKFWNVTEGAGIKVAVIDTGINYNHPDLKANYAGGYNAINPSLTPMDDQGHGTHVAGTIAAVRNNVGVVGVAPKARLYAVKVLGGDGSGSYSSIIGGVEWAVKQNVNVINMSLGGGGYMTAFHKSLKAAVNAGITVVCAAGNDHGAVSYPAKYPEAIAISALTNYDTLAYFSNRGPEIEFIAPGSAILSTSKSGGYEEMSGTSMACPHVAGLAALAISAGHKTPAQVRAAFKKASVKLSSLTNDQQGSGIIQANHLK